MDCYYSLFFTFIVVLYMQYGDDINNKVICIVLCL